jgi:Sulfotransferase family
VAHKKYSKKQWRRELGTGGGPHPPEPRVDPSKPELSLANWEDAEHLFGIARENLVIVDQPIVLISQIQRSGGTLLNKLFDSHPAVLSHPSELHVGHPTKADWPDLDPRAGPDAWLALLNETWIARRFEVGFGKRVLNRGGYPSLPFMIPPSFLEHLFRVVCIDRRPQAARQILDCYFTAFFNAWLDHQGLREEPKNWITAFTPRVAWGESRRRFRADYPDGRLMMCLRDPRAWYASAVRQKGKYTDLDEAVALWRRGAEEILAAKAEWGDAVFVLTYEDLVQEPEQVTKALAQWLEIEWLPILLRPTFNRLGTLPNSSYQLIGWGISKASLDHWRGVLSAETVATIEAQTMELDATVRAVRDVR